MRELSPDWRDKAKMSDRDTAPTFYSQMAKVVDGMKQEKFGASSVVSMLRGRGVKAEEIKWSGIEAWLEGKKSVTKAELQEFIAGSMLQIEETVFDGSKPENIEVKRSGFGKLGLYVNGKLAETYTKDTTNIQTKEEHTMSNKVYDVLKWVCFRLFKSHQLARP